MSNTSLYEYAPGAGANADAASARWRAASFVLLALGLGLGFLFLRDNPWQASDDAHTHIELTAALLALIAGVLALVRFYSRRQNAVLLLGTGLLGAAFLDGYHAAITTHGFADHFTAFFHEDIDSLQGWSGVASRVFLSIMMLASFLAWRREKRLGAAGKISTKTLYTASALFIIASFAFFAFGRLPAPYFPQWMVPRPQALVSAFFFLAALIGYLAKGEWKTRVLDYWIVLSLILGVFGQALFASTSERLFDVPFIASHSLRLASYAAMLTGLLASLLALFRRADAALEVTRQEATTLAQAEKSLAQFKTTLDQTLDCVFMFDASTLKFFYANRGAMEQVGYSAAELMTMTPIDIKPLVDETSFRQMIQPLLSGERSAITFETLHRHRSGRLIPVEIFLQYIHAAGESARFVAIVRDVSERKRGQSALEEREARLRGILENVVDGVITIDAQCLVRSFNPSAERIFGYSTAEVLGRNVKMLMPDPYRTDHDNYVRQYLKTGQAKVIGIGREVVGLRKDGSTFPLDLAVSEMTIGRERLFAGVVRDITDRKRIERMKSEFVSTVSHELRTPLTSIMGALGLLRSGTLATPDEEARGLVDIAYANSERLVRLINDILDMEKIESGRMDFHLRPVALVPVVEESLVACEDYARRYNVRLVLEPLPEGVSAQDLVMADPDRLSQVMANLLSNAAKFSPPGGVVRVSLARGAEGLAVSVADRGEGIPDEFQSRVFQKFAQADSSDTRRQGGTGLGLSISKSIIDYLHGTIGFKSRPGEGTVFTFTLPEYHGRVETMAKGMGAHGECRLLICESDPKAAAALSQIFIAEGCTVDTVWHASEAREKIAREDYKAITLSPTFAGSGGLAFVHELRRYKNAADVPLIVVSASPDEDSKTLKGGALGVLDWLVKPIDPVGVRQTIERLRRHYGKNLLHVLHVEDEADVVRFTATLVGDIATLVAVDTLRRAKEEIARGGYDLVLLDIGLPDGSGLDLLPAIRASANPLLPVVIFSAQDVSPDVSRAVAAALVKSQTSNEELLAAIRAFVGQPAGADGANDLFAS